MGLFTKTTLLSSCILLSLPGQVFAQESSNPQADEAPWSMANEFWDSEELKKARDELQAEGGGQLGYMIMDDRLEYQSTTGDGTLVFDTQGWYGGDINKLWIKAEGEFSLNDNELEDAELQALWSRAISPFFDFQAGVRYDYKPGGRTYGVVGLQGLAPYWFEVDAAIFLSTEGDFTSRVELEYELLFTQKLILQPRVEMNVSAQDIPDLNIGAGFTDMEAGLRLRYEFVPEFAPYIGVEWQKKFGETADLVKVSGGDPDDVVAVVGIRAWF